MIQLDVDSGDHLLNDFEQRIFVQSEEPGAKFVAFGLSLQAAGRMAAVVGEQLRYLGTFHLLADPVDVAGELITDGIRDSVWRGASSRFARGYGERVGAGEQSGGSVEEPEASSEH